MIGKERAEYAFLSKFSFVVWCCHLHYFLTYLTMGYPDVRGTGLNLFLSFTFFFLSKHYQVG